MLNFRDDRLVGSAAVVRQTEGFENRVRRSKIEDFVKKNHRFEVFEGAKAAEQQQLVESWAVLDDADEELEVVGDVWASWDVSWRR